MRSLLPGSGSFGTLPGGDLHALRRDDLREPDGHYRGLDLSAAGGFSPTAFAAEGAGCDHEPRVDGSEAMLAIARAHLPGHRWIHDLMERVEFDETVNAVVCLGLALSPASP